MSYSIHVHLDLPRQICCFADIFLILILILVMNLKQRNKKVQFDKHVSIQLNLVNVDVVVKN